VRENINPVQFLAGYPSKIFGNKIITEKYSKQIIPIQREIIMKRLTMLACACALVFASNLGVLAADTHSGQAVEDASKAGSHASASAAHGVVASGQVTSAASAVPLAVSGSAGAVSTEIAKDLMEAATAPIGTPLEMTDESVVAGPPPNEALAPKKP